MPRHIRFLNSLTGVYLFFSAIWIGFLILVTVAIFALFIVAVIIN